MAFYGLAPAILGLHVAVPLLVYGVMGQLFTPNNEMHGAWRHFLGLAEAFVALCLFYGAATRAAALVLAGLWVAGMFVFSPEPMLESLHILGYAGFFYLAGRGPIAVDRLLFPRLEPPARLVPLAPVLLRIGLGGGLAIVGFTEKLANIPLAEAFLRQHPYINFTPALGIPMSDELFALWRGRGTARRAHDPLRGLPPDDHPRGTLPDEPLAHRLQLGRADRPHALVRGPRVLPDLDPPGS